MCDDDIVERSVGPPEPGESDFDNHCCFEALGLTSCCGARVQTAGRDVAPELLGGAAALLLDVGGRQSDCGELSHSAPTPSPLRLQQGTCRSDVSPETSRQLRSLTMTTQSGVGRFDYICLPF